MLVLPHVARPLLYPDKKFKDLKFPEVKEENHWGRFVDACLGGARTTAGFDYSGPLAEAVLVGTVAVRFPQTTLQWNAAALAFGEARPTGSSAANTARLGRQGTFLSTQRRVGARCPKRARDRPKADPGRERIAGPPTAR